MGTLFHDPSVKNLSRDHFN